MDKILNKISITASGTNLKHYLLTHQQISPFQYKNLVKVQELNGDETEELTPLSFTYQAATEGISYTPVIDVYLGSGGTSISASNSEVITHDFTGNGIMDMIVYPKDKTKFNYFRDPELEASTQPSPIIHGQEITGAFEELFPANILYHNNTLSGNGLYVVKNQGLTFSVYGAGSSYAPLIWQYSKSWSEPPRTPEFWSGCTEGIPFYGGETLPMTSFISGDFNGDGLTDILAITQPYQYVYDQYFYYGEPDVCVPKYTSVNSSDAYSIDMKRGNVDEPSFADSFHQPVLGSFQLYTADFNGDGKTNILHISGKNYYVYELNSDNYLTLLFQGNNNKFATNLPILIGDYNGDGKADFMMPSASTGNDRNLFVHFYSTGTSFKCI